MRPATYSGRVPDVTAPSRPPVAGPGVLAAPVDVPVERPDVAPVPASTRAWTTVVWNDPVNLMDYVTYVLRTYFGYPEAIAHRLMLAVHEEGRATVSRGTREQMEVDAQAMHGFGLWATVEAGGEDGQDA